MIISQTGGNGSRLEYGRRTSASLSGVTFGGNQAIGVSADERPRRFRASLTFGAVVSLSGTSPAVGSSHLDQRRPRSFAHRRANRSPLPIRLGRAGNDQLFPARAMSPFSRAASIPRTQTINFPAGAIYAVRPFFGSKAS